MKQSSTDRVAVALREHGIEREIVTFDASTRTAADAAAALGCDVGQIVKSLVFRGETSDRPVLVVASGAGRVDEALVAEAVGEPIAKADAAFVRDRTGFAIGGVAPLGHREPPIVVVDEDLLALDVLWAAAGTPNAVFTLDPDQLVRISGGKVARVRQ
jgi:prolyl-tRNA editing enzyme YbaK/EbsC (Cys-tRNA(Pro) deacylase)